MANAFDQFDGAPTAFGAPVPPPVSAQPSGQGAQNAFDAFDGQPTAFGPSSSAIGGEDADTGSQPATITSLAKNFGTGMIAGIPNLATTVQHALTPPNPITAVKNWWDVVSNPDAYKLSGDISPELKATLAQQQQDRQAALGPGVGEIIKRGLGQLGFDPDNPEQMPQPQNAPERIARMAGEGASSSAVLPGAGLGTNVLLGTTSGAGAGIGRELAPDKYKDVAGLVGGLVGGGVGAVASELPSAVRATARTATDYVAPMAAPYSPAIRERIAGQTLSRAAQDPDAAIAAISSAPSEIVPGSKPTTFQATGDVGLGQLERAVATKSPGAFLDRRAEQNAARLDALSNIEAQGHPEAVGSFFRDQLNDIDQQMQAAQDAAATSARSATEGLGGGHAPEVLGENLRAPLQNTLDAAKTNERALWKAVDPEGTMQVAATPLKTAYADVYGKLGPESSIGMTPVEKQLGDVIQSYGDALPLQRMIDLRSVISKAMRDANSPLQANSIAYGRLSQLRGAVEDAISDSVTQKAAQEQQAVQMGAMQPENAIGARLAQEASAFVNAKRAVSGSVGGGGAQSGAYASGRSQPSPGQVRGGGTQEGAPLGTAGNQEAQGAFLDQAAADRLKAATAATAERKQTFGQPAVAKILQRPGTTQPYTMPGGAVSSTAWKAGASGGDAVNAILKASPEAIGPLKDIAAASLRSKAQDGILTGKQLDAWKAQHAPALKALEQASPGSTAVFENAAKAGDHLALLAQQRKDTLAAVEKSAVGRLLKLDDPADVVKTIGSVFNRSDAVKTMRGLAQAASRDPAAMQGLRRAVVEYMEQRLISNTEAGTSGHNLIKADAFQSFLGKNHTALRQVFSDQEIGTMRAIAQDLKRANRSIAGSKLPGQSNTAQDLSAMESYELKPTLLSKLFTHVVGGGAGFALDGGLTGTLAGLVGSHVISGLREAGIRTVDDLVRDAMLNPDLAGALLMKAPKKVDTGSELTLANKLRRIGMVSAVQNSNQQ